MKFRTFAIAALCSAATAGGAHAAPDFASFDQRARAGENLTVAFFGASLTWGANASDPQQTSYRADVSHKFIDAYPKAHFKFIDGAIGGTGSQLGVFRLDRDVLSKNPDLVFLDFSANDDIYSDSEESLASYESLVRRLIVDAKVPVVQVIFPFKWNVKPGEMAKMKRRDAHKAISAAYHTAVGDAIELANHRVESGLTTLSTLWPLDGVHPGDKGYALFADAAWSGYWNGVKDNVMCAAPSNMLHANTYMHYKRVRISTLGKLPDGWNLTIPNRVSAWFDGLMSRWLDDEVIASNRHVEIGADGKKVITNVDTVAPLKVRFRGTMVLLFGEETLKSGLYKATIDGKVVTNPNGGATPELFSASALRMGGNRQHVQTLATGLDASVLHTLEIAPQFPADPETELRLESICVAGPGADVLPALPAADVKPAATP